MSGPANLHAFLSCLSLLGSPGFRPHCSFLSSRTTLNLFLPQDLCITVSSGMRIPQISNLPVSNLSFRTLLKYHLLKDTFSDLPKVVAPGPGSSLPPV